jgi:hypothetical protein
MRLLRIPEPFNRPDLIFEPKLDGFHALAHVRGHRCELVSRNGHTFKQWPQLAAEIAHAVGAHSAVLDGEVCCLEPDGRTHFNKLLFRREWPTSALDVLSIEGEDLRAVPAARAEAQAPAHHADRRVPLASSIKLRRLPQRPSESEHKPPSAQPTQSALDRTKHVLSVMLANGRVSRQRNASVHEHGSVASPLRNAWARSYRVLRMARSSTKAPSRSNTRSWPSSSITRSSQWRFPAPIQHTGTNRRSFVGRTSTVSHHASVDRLGSVAVGVVHLDDCVHFKTGSADAEWI